MLLYMHVYLARPLVLVKTFMGDYWATVILETSYLAFLFICLKGSLRSGSIKSLVI